MVLNVPGRFCPVCKHENAHTASICAYCGTSLEEAFSRIGVTTKNTDSQPNVSSGNLGSSFIDVALIPKNGIGIYVDESYKPYYLQVDKEVIIGRKTEGTSEAFLDLSELPAFHMGLSRRHAMIRRIESSFEVIDLSSTNGSWLNNERLIPNKPYPFASGSQFRLGRMQLFVMYHTDLKGTKKK